MRVFQPSARGKPPNAGLLGNDEATAMRVFSPARRGLLGATEVLGCWDSAGSAGNQCRRLSGLDPPCSDTATADRRNGNTPA